MDPHVLVSRADEAMLRYADGDESAFGVLYDELSPILLRFLFRGVRNRATAEELTQQTFLAIHRARGSFHSGASVRPWVYAIARRLMLDTLRKQKRRPEDELTETDLPHSLHTPESSFIAIDEVKRLMEKLETLPENQRVVFELVRLEGLSMAEVAAVLGISESAAKLRAHRAYIQLGIAGHAGGQEEANDVR